MMNRYTVIVLFLYIFTTFSHCFGRRDCVVSEWNKWADCSSKCTVGRQIRNRTVIVKPVGFFSKPCFHLVENQACGKRYECRISCDRLTGNCLCWNGYKLAEDRKSCTDINECSYNNNRGRCSHRCKNFPGRYNCSCFQGFKLSSDGHDCIYDQSFEVCNKRLKHFNEEGKCVCKNKLSGLKCDRNTSLCQNDYICQDNEVCLTFVFAKNKCVNTVYQLPLLLSIPFNTYITGNIQYKTEKYIEDILEGSVQKEDSLQNGLNKKTRRELGKVVYVEGSLPLAVKSSFTYVRFVVLDVINNFSKLKAQTLCQNFENTDVRCLNQADCNLLRSVGIACSFVYTPTTGNLSDKQKQVNALKPWMYSLIFGLIVAVAISVLFFLFLKRRMKKPYKNVTSLNITCSMQHQEPLITIPPCPETPLQDIDELQAIHRINDMDNFDNNVFSCNQYRTMNNELYNVPDNKVDPIYQSIGNIDSIVKDKDGLKVAEDRFYVPPNKKKVEKTVVELPDEEPRYSKPPSRNINV